MPHALPVPVSDTDDESPAYRVKGTEIVLFAEYSPDAPMELIRHVFELDLSCYWSIRGCDSTRQVATLVWHDKQAIEARATARLHGSGNPCPDSVLAGRIRYLPDLHVELHEVADYNHSQAKPAPVSPSLKVGDRVLAFTGATFESCQVVQATPPAESAVRSTVPALKRREDEVSIGGRM